MGISLMDKSNFSTGEEHALQIVKVLVAHKHPTNVYA